MERSLDGINPLFEYPGMNPIWPHTHISSCIYIQLEWQIMLKFRSCWEFIILAVMVFPLSALLFPGLIMDFKIRGEKGIKCLCFVCAMD